MKEYRKNHKEQQKEYAKQRYIKNKNKILQQNKEWCKNHKKERKKYRKKYYQKNREKFLQQGKKYRKNHKQEFKKRRKNSYHNHIDGKIHIRFSHNNPYLFYRGGKAVHRVIAEKILGRRLKKKEVVHHIDGNTLNNENSNLLICTIEYHTWLHNQIKIQDRKLS
jgi:hypothetical protein